MAIQPDLSDAERERLRQRLFEVDEVELIYCVLGLHKVIESQQDGKLYEFAQMLTTALTTAFTRFAPEPLGEMLKRWEENDEPGLTLVEGGFDG
jgi:hypothetical protein